MLETFAEVFTGPQREDAEIRLKLFKSEFRMRKYDAACVAYRDLHGRIPTADELYAAGLVDEPPTDLLDAPMTIDAGCRARTKFVFVREDEALDRIGMESRKAEQFEKARKEAMKAKKTTDDRGDDVSAVGNIDTTTDVRSNQDHRPGEESTR